MKRKLLLFSLLLALMAPWAANAQTTVEIGDGTTVSYYAPIGTLYNYSITEQLYTADEIEMAGTITSISFNYTGVAAKDFPIEVYMKQVDANDLSTGISLADAELVFQGTLSVTTTAGWVTIPLDNPFAYDGTSNLLIGINKGYVYWFSGETWYYTSTPNMTRYSQQDSSGYTTTTTPGTVTSNRPNIQIEIIPAGGPTCNKPDEFTAGNLTSTSALLSWTGGEGTYNVEYKKASDQEWTPALTNSTLTQIELSGLAPGTNYQARVQSACGTDPETGDPFTSGWKNVSFATMFGIPLIEPFATTTIPNGWARYSGLLSNVMSGTALTSITSYWTFGPGYNGVFDSHAYINNYSTGHYFWLVTPAVLMENNVEVSFDLALTKYSGTLQPVDPAQQSDDKFVVLITTDGGTTWEILRQWDNEGSEYVYNNIACSATGEYVAIDLSSYAGQNIAVAFYAESTVGNNGDNNLHIDNVSIDYIPSCPKPSGLAYSEVTGHTANLTWTPGTEGQTQWQICLNGDEGHLQLVTSTDGAYTLTGLTGQTPYTAKVRAYCSETDQSPWSNQVSFTTDVTCVAPTSLTASYITNHSATLDWTSDASEWILAYKLSSAHDSTYVNVPVTEKPYVLDGLTPETRYTVRVRANCGEVDGLSAWSGTTSFNIREAYPAPGNLTCDSAFAYTAYFSWDEWGTPELWEVAYKLATDPDDAYDTIPTFDNPFMLGNIDPLLPGTDYVIKVHSIYFTVQGDTASAWSAVVPFTTLQTCPAPTEFAVIDSTINAYGATLNWHSNYSDSWTVKYREPAYMIGTEEHFNTNSAPQGWTRYTGLLSDVMGGTALTETTGGWIFSNTNVFGAYHTKVNVFSTSVKYWLVSPELTLADGPAMSFDLALTDYGNADPIEDATAQADDKFVVLIYANDAWTILREWNNSGSEDVYNTIATTGENVSIDLSAYQGQTVKVAFYAESTASGGDNDLHIDNVLIGTPVAATEWTEVSADAVPFELTGLNPETYYEVVVTSTCGEETSEESASVFFTTTPSCLAPTELTVANESVTAHAATLSWTENGSATEWVIEYTAVVNEEAVTNTINVTENPYTLTGLLAETPYAVKVQAYCSTTDQSDWSNTARFTTTVACPAPTELAVDEESITTNGATLTWNGTSESYILQMADLSAATISEEVVEAFSENFEGGSVPAGWTNEGDASWTVGTGDYYTSTGAHGGTYNAKINHSDYDEETYLVSPAIDLSAYANAMLSCWYVNRSWSGDIDGFGVYYRLGNGEWNELFSTTAAHSSWTQLSQLSLPSEPNVQLGFKFTDEYGYGVGLDDILIEGNPLTYEWTTFDSEATSPYTFEGLTPGTTYMVRVIGDCGEEGQSLPSEAISFTTMATCVVPTDFAATDVTAHTATLVWNGENDSYIVNYREAAGTNVMFEEGFENGIGNWTIRDGVTSTGIATSGAHSGDAAFEFYYGYDNQYLISPEITEEITEGASLQFYYTNGSSYYAPETFQVGFSSTDNALASFTYGQVYSVSDLQWHLYSEQIPAGTKFICWKYTSYDMMSLTIDDIVVGVPTEAGEWMTATAADTTVVLNNLLAATTYEAMVQAVCTEDDSSAFTDIISFTTTVACPAITSLAADTVGTHMAVISWVETGEATAWQICLNGDEDNLIEVVANTENDTITYTLEGLAQDADITVKVRANCGDEDGTSIWTSISFHTLVACERPSNLAVENIGTESATLMWEGESESYVVQYRPWEQVGEDVTTDDVMTTYTFDLSEYSGNGSIAIRHYNVWDQFWLIVDDIVLTNAQGETVFSENFESGSTYPTMDMDGDGHDWMLMGTSLNVNGNYGYASESYDNDIYVALYPDNWLIISGVELGGQLTLAARGQEAGFAAEVFGVFVSPENGFVEEIVEDTQIDLWELTPSTTYAWQVKGICGEDESQWVASSFTTMEDYLTFVTDGDWNDANNWDPAQVPTTDNNVHIQANAIIPAGVVAEANKVTIVGGSITIKEGGQMKLNSQANVTMEKEIVGYGEGNGNYYLLASPLTSYTVFVTSQASHVDSLIYNTYDLYTFDRTYGVDEEWVNYKAHPEHINFQSASGNFVGLLENEGYLYANQVGSTLLFTGSIKKNIGNTVTKTVAYDSINRGWALVGNNFACNAYLTVFDGEDDMLEANYYVMNAAGDDFELAETANGIAPMTAAFVNFGTTGAKIQISSEEPNTSKYGRTGKFVMSLNQEGNTVDKAVLRFGKGMGLEKMSLKNNSKLYFSNNDKDYAVVYTMRQGEMPVNFKAETAGNYTINFAADGVSFKELVLVDNVNETKVDLLANPSYTFETEAGEFAGRFTIVYRVK